MIWLFTLISSTHFLPVWVGSWLFSIRFFTLTGAGHSLPSIFFKFSSQSSKLPFQFWLYLVRICQKSACVYFRFSFYQALFMPYDLWPSKVFCHLPQLFSIEFVIPESANRAGMRDAFFSVELLTHRHCTGSCIWIRKQVLSDILVFGCWCFF